MQASDSNIRYRIAAACWIWLSLFVLWAFLVSRVAGHGVYAYARNGPGFELCFMTDATYVAASNGHARWSRIGYGNESRLNDWDYYLRMTNGGWHHWLGFNAQIWQSKFMLRLPWWAVLGLPLFVTSLLCSVNWRRATPTTVQTGNSALLPPHNAGILSYQTAERRAGLHRRLTIAARSTALLAGTFLCYDVFGGAWRLELPAWAYLIQICAGWLAIFFVLMLKTIAGRVMLWPGVIAAMSLVVPWLLPRINR